MASSSLTWAYSALLPTCRRFSCERSENWCERKVRTESNRVTRVVVQVERELVRQLLRSSNHTGIGFHGKPFHTDPHHACDRQSANTTRFKKPKISTIFVKSRVELTRSIVMVDWYCHPVHPQNERGKRSPRPPFVPGNSCPAVIVVDSAATKRHDVYA